MIEPAPPSWNVHDLARMSGLTVRTVRQYSARGVLPKARFRGAYTVYGPEHVGRLRAIRRLRKQGLDLDEIRDALARMDPAEVAALEAEVYPPLVPPVAPAPPAPDPEPAPAPAPAAVELPTTR